MEVSIYGYCQMACSACFANRNRDAFERELNPTNSAPALLRQLGRVLEDEESPLGFFLREKYPVCFSNTTDPFQREEKNYRASEAFLGWAQAMGVPVYVQTRGNVLYEEWERYAPLLDPGRVVVYLSLCGLDDADRKRHEPGALSVPKRLELMRRLADKGVPVIAACNPWTKEWAPDPGAYCAAVAQAGGRGVWWEALHLTGAQADVLAPTYRAELLSQANVMPMFLIGPLKEWAKQAAAHGLDFFPSPKWDAYFGHRARHPECADPAWLGGKTLDFAFKIAASLARLSEAEGGAKVGLGWPEIEAALGALGVPNPTLRTSDFWYPFNNRVTADRASWNAGLGKRAALWEVLRYFWNHPFENQSFLWYHPFLRWAYEDGAYATDADGNLTGLYDPTIKHHGNKTVAPAAVDWDRVAWPRYEAVPATTEAR